MRDGPELGDDLVMGHADAVVADRQRARCLVDDDLDLPFARIGQDILVRERFVARLVYGIGRVRDKLPQEDLLVRIEGVDHQVQQLFYLGLEFHFFSSHDFTPFLFVVCTSFHTAGGSLRTAWFQESIYTYTARSLSRGLIGDVGRGGSRVQFDLVERGVYIQGEIVLDPVMPKGDGG